MYYKYSSYLGLYRETYCEISAFTVNFQSSHLMYFNLCTFFLNHALCNGHFKNHARKFTLLICINMFTIKYLYNFKAFLCSTISISSSTFISSPSFKIFHNLINLHGVRAFQITGITIKALTPNL